MKKILSIIFAGGLMASLTGCDSLLNDNRYPMATQTNTPEFWNSTTNVQGEINYLYSEYKGYGDAAGRNGTFYFASLNDDQVGNADNAGFYEWIDLNVPANQSSWTTAYQAIRRCNTVIEGVEGSSLSDVQKNNYIAQACLNRAREYYILVQRFGDVPLVLEVLDPSDTEILYGPRTPRNQVMDQVLADLNYAIANLTTTSAKMEFSQDMANALKAEICLFEASYQKYNAGNDSRANQFFQEVITAASPLLNKYAFCSDYHSLYNSSYDGEDGTTKLQDNPEIIFMKAYQTGNLMNSTPKYTSSAVLTCGMSKDAFDSYLFLDGKPKALTSEDTNDMGYMDETGLCIQDLLDVRDKRLAMTIDPYLSFGTLNYFRSNSEGMRSSTGYTICKFISPQMNFNSCTIDNRGYANAPLFWKSKLALEYAEAKAELGQLTDADMDITLNPLYTRAGLPAQTVASLSSMNDPANNMGVSSLLWEVRRCRRCELMFDGFRYWDLIRWHQLELMDTNNYPNVNLGANITPALDQYPFDNVNGYIHMFSNTRTFNNKYYLYPIGQAQINLNPNLTQNPGW